MLRRTFTVSPQLQEFLAGLGSRAVANVVLTSSYNTTAPLLPTNPESGVRRTLYYSHIDTTSATPVEYDAFVQNLNGLNPIQLTRPR